MKLSRKQRALAQSIACLAGGIGLAATSIATVNTFTVGGASWNVNSNWSTGITPQSSNSLLFNSASVADGSTTTLDNSYSFQTLSYDIGANSTSLNANAIGTTSRTLTFSGGVDALGASGNLIDLSSATTGTVTIGGAGGVGVTTLAMAASGAFNIGNSAGVLALGPNAVVSGTANLTKTGAGTLVLQGANTYTGQTIVSAGTVKLDFSAGGAPANNIVNSSSTLVMSGGTLLLGGSSPSANSQSFNGTILASGTSSSIQLSRNATPQNLALSLGAITRNLGSTIDFTLPSGAATANNGITTSSGSAGKILPGGVAYATVNGNDWAAKDPTNSFIVGLSTISGGYTPTTATSLSGNADVAAGVNTTLGGTASISSLRFNQSQSTTISLGANTMFIGGILVTPAVGNAPSTLSGGTLKAPPFQDLVIVQNNVANGLTITSSISNNGASATGLTKAGPGTLTLGGTSSYSLGTYLNGGQLNVNANGALGTGSLNLNGGNLDNTSGAAVTQSLSQIYWNHDFTFQGSNDLTLSGGVAIGGNRTVTVNGSVLTFAGPIVGAGLSVTKAGAGTLGLAGPQSFGSLIVNGGTVSASGAPVFPGVGSVTVNGGGAVQFTSDNALSGTNGATNFTINAGGSLAEANNASAILTTTLNLAGGTLASAATLSGSAATAGTFLLNKGLATGGIAATSTISAQNVALTQTGGTVFMVNSGATNGIDLDVTGGFFHASTSADTGLIKTGSGVMRLSGTNTYTGATKVNAGALILTGGATLSKSSITVSPGATLNVSGLSSGVFTLGSGQTLAAGRTSAFATDVTGNLATGAGAISPGGGAAAGTLTLNGNLTLNGGAINFDLGSATTVGNGQNDLITTTDLNLSSATTVAINSLPSTNFATGAYTLINYSGNLTGSASNLIGAVNGVLNTRTTYTFATTAPSNGAVTLTVGGQAAASLTWAGDGTSNVWDVKTTANFMNGASRDNFYNLDSVTFTDSGSGSPTIALTGNLTPAAVTVNNSTTAYTFGGTGAITGSTSLTKNGAGTLTLTTPNSYTGGTILNAGKLNLNNAAAIGAGTLTINGGTIDNTSGSATTLNNPISWSGDFSFGGSNPLDLTGPITLNGVRTLTVNGSGAMTIDGVIGFNGFGTGIVKAGSGNLTLNGVNAYAGGTNVSGGTLTVGPAGAIAGTVSIGSGATLNLPSLSAIYASSSPSTLSINGGTLNFYGPHVAAGGPVNTINLAGGLISGTSFDLKASSTISAQASSNTTAVISSGFHFTGSLTINGSHGASPSGVDLLISGPITSNGGGQLALSNSGVVELSGTNSYTDPTNVTGSGQLIIAGSSVSPTTLTGGTLVVSGSLSGSTSITNGTLTVSGNLSGNTALSTSTLRVDPAGTVSGSVTGNTGSTVTGTGTITGAVSMLSGSVLSPGLSGLGDLAIANNFSLNSGAKLSLAINGVSPGAQYGQLLCSNGTVTLGGALQFSLGYTPAVGDVFYLLLDSGSSAINGTFSNGGIDEGNGTWLITTPLPGGATEQFLLSYSSSASIGGIGGFAPGQGHDVALFALGTIPEPTSAVFIATAGGMLCGLRRFRRKAGKLAAHARLPQ